MSEDKKRAAAAAMLGNLKASTGVDPGPLQNYTLKLPVNYMAVFQAEAEAQTISRSAVIRAAMREYIEAHGLRAPKPEAKPEDDDK